MMGIPRHGGGMTRINVGTLRAGEGRNVIPSSAHMALEVRGETSSINDYMVENVKNIVEGIAKALTFRMKFLRWALPLISPTTKNSPTC